MKNNKINSSHSQFSMWVGASSKFLIVAVVLTLFLCSTSSCKKIFDVEPNRSQVNHADVFNDEKNATAALMGIYRIAGDSYMGGGSDGISLIPGLSSDEFFNIARDPEFLPYEENKLQPNDVGLLRIWKSSYQIIYQCNDLLEGLAASNKLTDAIKTQLSGEALFLRALNYFYLTNLFGDVPLVTTTRYQTNTQIPRSLVSDVLTQIIDDLETAHEWLRTDLVEERIRPSKSTVAALLARIHMYQGDDAKAITYASEVLNNAGYQMPVDLNTVFLRSSPEIIFQLLPPDGYNGPEPTSHLLDLGFNTYSHQLTESLLQAFSAADLRLQYWVNVFVDPGTGQSYPHMYKYKLRSWDQPVQEAFVSMRLAETYLIRAEALANEDQLSAAIADLDVIRLRAGLSSIAATNPTVSKEDLIQLIREERRLELFGECGHRWFDLKRWGLANATLSYKPGWNNTDELYPIPTEELIRNSALQQNPGY